MARLVFIRHGAVEVRPERPSPDWALSAEGRAGLAALRPALGPLPASIWSSDEAKTRQSAALLAGPEGPAARICAESNETRHGGFLPAEAFDAAITRFFGQPDDPPPGWESARAAQERGVLALKKICAEAPPGDIWILGHGRMGALLNAHLRGRAISRDLWPRDFGARFVCARGDWSGCSDWIAPQT